MSAYREIQESLKSLGPTIVKRMLLRATLGDLEAEKALLPYVLPRATKQVVPVSCRVEIDISSLAAAKDTLSRIATAIGHGEIGMDEGNMLMESIGKAIDRMTQADVNELAARLQKLEEEQATQVAAPRASGTSPVSRANGSTPGWGNIVHHPSLKVVGEE